ncbi:hypothetical protein J5X84_41385 [Streptosporangiaceae bacterium NEAU-GS5]|nr:hypothetical protein [Streptosporangiaceae bacterium NEAU-GS5]
MKKATRVFIGVVTALAVVLPATAANARSCYRDGSEACARPNCCMLA